MRISVHRNDPGRANYERHPLARITLDGEQVTHVYTADEELGFVEAAVRNAAGYVVANNGEIELERRYGKVKIVLYEQA